MIKLKKKTKKPEATELTLQKASKIIINHNSQLTHC